MKKKFYWMLMALLVLPALHVSAKEVTQKKALEVATQFMNSRSALRNGTSLELVLTGKSENTTLRSSEKPSYYVYNVKDGKGFVIVAGDDVAAPILGYSFSSSFKAEGMPANLKFYLNRYDEQIRKAAEMGLETSAAWSSLRSTKSESGKVLETAKWDQDAPFNGECPMIINPKGQEARGVTGCAATAASIVMAYHKYPSTLVGGKFTYTSECEDFIATDGKKYNNTQEITINLDRTYNWDLMLDEYVEGEYTEAQGKEVAALMARVGAAAKMNYEADESGSTVFKVYRAAINNYQFTSAKIYYRDYMTDDDFRSLLIKDIDADRPILYASQTGGHIFVCDGYDGNGNFHFNWGWGGVANGFFSLDAMKPSDTGIGAGDLGDYTGGAVIVANLKPSTEEKVGGMYLYNDTFNEMYEMPSELGIYKGKGVENIVQGETFSVDLKSVNQFVSVDNSVVFGVAHVDNNFEIKEIVGKSSKKNVSGAFIELVELIQELGSEQAFMKYLQQNPDFVEKMAKSVFFETISCKIQQPIEEGDRLIAVSQSNDGDQWTPIFTYIAGEDDQQGENVQEEEGEEEEGEGEETVVELPPYFIELTAGATANEKVVAVADQSLCVRGNILVLQTEEPLRASVYNISGALVKQQTVAGTAQIALSKGIYVVQLGNKAYKVVIKK